MANKLFELDAFSYLGEILAEMKKEKPEFDIVEGTATGGRKSGKTTNYDKFGAASTLLFPRQCDLYIWRYFVKDAKQSWKELKAAYRSILGRDLNPRKEVNETERMIKINGNEASVWGANDGNSRKSVTASGIFRAKGKKYCVLMLDEGHEFTNEDIISIRHATGGYKYVIFVKMFNPHSLGFPIIKATSLLLPYNKQELIKTGQQFAFWKSKEVIEGRGEVVKWSFVHHSNWRVNSFLSNAEILNIIETHKISPQRAIVADYGMPAAEIGAIYGYEKEFAQVVPLGEIMSRFGANMDELSGGLDYGEGESETSSATAFSLWSKEATTDDNVGAEKWFLLWQYRWHNKNGYKTHEQRINEILDGTIGVIRAFPKLRELFKHGFIIQSEWVGPLIEQLRNEIERRRISEYIDVQRTHKYLKITRIAIRKYKLNTRAYYVAKETAEPHIFELEIQIYKEGAIDKKTGQQIPEDKNDDTTDAGDYATWKWSREVYAMPVFQTANKGVQLN